MASDAAPPGPRPDLPPRYYHDHFQTMLAFVERHYRSMFRADEAAFVDDLRALGLDARCLYLRLCGRKPVRFRRDGVTYAEIADTDAALEELAAAKFIRWIRVGEEDGEDAAMMSLFTRGELLAVYPGRGAKGLGKPELARRVLDAVGLDALLRKYPVFEQERVGEYRKLTLMFFGTTQVSMEQFVLRDIGQVRYEALEADALTPAFRSREEFDALHEAIDCDTAVEECLAAGDPERGAERVAAWFEKHPDPEGEAARMMGKAGVRIGRALERSGRVDAALACYARTAMPPSRERRIRLLDSRDPGEALAIALEMLDAPRGPDERMFARDYLKKRIAPAAVKRITERLRQAETIVVDGSAADGPVEERALAYFRARGWEGWFAENGPWRLLLGLVCWDVFFADPERFHHPFQRAPDDFYHPDFHRRRSGEIERALEALRAPGLGERLRARYQEKASTANPLVTWHAPFLEAAVAMAARVPGELLEAVCRRMCRDLASGTRGFPDLFLIRGDACRFVEIKAAGDVLSPEQLAWFDFFDEIGLRAELIRVLTCP